jgi:glycosyltransferase involved in cell wall biosynthesis
MFEVGAMRKEAATFAGFDKDSLFLVWGPPSHGPRSTRLAGELGIAELHFISSVRGRGLRWAAPKYGCQAVRTLALLFGRRPRVVFVQSPPSLAVPFVSAYCALTGGRYLIDAHSAAFQLRAWTWPRWLHAFLARQAVATIVTNDHLAEMVRKLGGRAFVLPDVPTTFPQAEPPVLAGGFNLTVVNTFSEDEPLGEVLAAAADLPDFHFYVTGRKKSAPKGLLERAPTNVHFTDFLPDDRYYALMNASHGVVCLTTRDHTMQRGACEALWLGKPVITSDWPLLREYFSRGAIYVEGRAASIREGALRLRAQHPRYQAAVLELQAERRRDWQSRVESLTELIGAARKGGEE